MHFTILPEKKSKCSVSESSKDYLTIVFPKEDNISRFCQKHLVPILSFFIPFSILMLFMAILGFAPFGDKSLFVWDGLSKNITLLANIQQSIQDGSFSFLTLTNTISEEYLYLFFYYYTSPFHFIALFLPSVSSIVYLQLLCVLEISLSGYFFSYYLTHRRHGRCFSSNDFSVLLFSCAYALSSYMLVQYNDFMFLEIAMLFPLLVCFYEQMLYNGSSKNFRFLLAICFCLQFHITCIALLFFLVYLLIFKGTKEANRFSQAARYFYNCLLGLLYSAPLSLPGIYLYLHIKSFTDVSPNFSLHTGLFSFFSKFMPMNYPSYYNTSVTHGINLYCGLFILFLLPVFFTSKRKSLQEKLHTAIFLLLLFCSVNLTQIQHMILLSSNDTSAFNCYSFIFIFYLLSVCSDSLYEYRETRWFFSLAGFMLPFVLYFIACCFAKDYSRSSSMSTALIFFVLYGIYLILYLRRSIQPASFYALLLLTTLLELSINAYTQLDDALYIASPVQTKLVSEQTAFSDRTQNPFTEDIDGYTLPCFYKTPVSDYQSISEKGNTFDIQNHIAEKLGSNSPLFDKAKLDIACKNLPDDLTCRIYENNIISLHTIKDEDEEGSTQPLPKENIMLTITPEKSGDLYLYTTELVHIGMVKEGVPFEYKFSFLPSVNVYSNYWIQSAYIDTDVLQKLTDICKTDTSLSTDTGLFSLTATGSFSEACMLVSALPYSRFVKVSIDGSPADTVSSLNGTIAVPVSAGSHTIRYMMCFTPFFFAIILWGISLLCTVLYQKRILYSYLVSGKKRIHTLCDKAHVFCHRHAVALLSFGIPFAILFIGYLLASCVPFGQNTWLDRDGSVLTLAMLRQRKYELANGNLFYSWTSGSGSNIFNSMPNTILSFWLTLIPDTAMNIVLSMIELFRIALCGSSMYIYLTRKLNGKQIWKTDYRVLIFSSAYSLCAYILNMHSYFHWTNVLILFPLIILAMDHLMIQKKFLPYTLLLALSIISDYNISLFICIFLVMWFFTYRYASFRDFMEKGIRFALCSILSAGMGFWVLYALQSNLAISPYIEQDSVAPGFTFYQSYWDSLKQLFLFSDPVIVTTNNGAINLYCGLFLILLLVLTICSLKKEKRTFVKLAMLLFIFFSSNNELLSYLWNGMHYQVKVPNRYSFLLAFLIIDLSYESLLKLRHIKLRRMAAATILLCGLIVATMLLCSEKFSSTLLWINIVFLLLYILLLWGIRLYKTKRRLITQFFISVALLELTISTCYNFKTIYTNMDLTNYLLPVSNEVSKEYLSDPTIDRVNYIASTTTNAGMANNLANLQQFNSYLTKWQFNVARRNGSSHSNNVIENTNNLMPFSLTFSNVSYIILDQYSYNDYMDLSSYEPVGTYDHSIILQNKKLLSSAFYLPASMKEAINTSSSPDSFANILCEQMGIKEKIFTDHALLVSKKRSAKDAIGYITLKDDEDSDDENTDNIYIQNIHFTAPTNGYYYYMVEEYYSLGYLEEGQTYDFTLETYGTNGYLCVYHDDVMQKLTGTLQPYTFHTTESSHTSLSGTITLPEDGLVTFSIPYEPGWSAYVDGKKVETMALGDAYLCVNASKGEHQITIRFFPTSLILGVAITLLSWGIFFLLCILTSIKKKKVSINTEVTITD